MAFYDLSTRALRSGFKPKHKAYWQRITANFHVGIRVAKTKRARWTCKVRQLEGRYKQKFLSLATTNDPNGNAPEAIGFKEAMKEAEALRATQIQFGTAAPPYRLWYDGKLTYCPIGDVITVGPALHHFIEWRRLAAARSTFIVNVSSLNHHLVPRLVSIPLAEFDGQHFHAFCGDVLETAPKRDGHHRDRKMRIEDLSEEELRKRKKTLNGQISILRLAFQLA